MFPAESFVPQYADRYPKLRKSTPRMSPFDACATEDFASFTLTVSEAEEFSPEAAPAVAPGSFTTIPEILTCLTLLSWAASAAAFVLSASELTDPVSVTTPLSQATNKPYLLSIGSAPIFALRAVASWASDIGGPDDGEYWRSNTTVITDAISRTTTGCGTVQLDHRMRAVPRRHQGSS